MIAFEYKFPPLFFPNWDRTSLTFLHKESSMNGPWRGCNFLSIVWTLTGKEQVKDCPDGPFGAWILSGFDSSLCLFSSLQLIRAFSALRPWSTVIGSVQAKPGLDWLLARGFYSSASWRKRWVGTWKTLWFNYLSAPGNAVPTFFFFWTYLWLILKSMNNCCEVISWFICFCLVFFPMLFPKKNDWCLSSKDEDKMFFTE